jgi:hypothetical protein
VYLTLNTISPPKVVTQLPKPNKDLSPGSGADKGTSRVDGCEEGAQHWGTEVARPIETDWVDVVSSEVAGRRQCVDAIRGLVLRTKHSGDRRRFLVAVTRGGKGQSRWR